MPAKQTAISTEQIRMLQLLVLGRTQTEAAQELGVSSRTIIRWLELPYVQEAYETLKQDMARCVAEEIKRLAGTAVNALKDSLTSAQVPTVRFNAATYVLNRVAPESALQSQNEASGPIPAELLPYLEEPEIVTIEQLLARAQTRKQEADSKVTPIRKQA